MLTKFAVMLVDIFSHAEEACGFQELNGWLKLLPAGAWQFLI